MGSSIEPAQGYSHLRGPQKWLKHTNEEQYICMDHFAKRDQAQAYIITFPEGDEMYG